MKTGVLVVDDDAEIRELLSRTLGRAGYDVILAATGEEALARLDETVACLVVDKILPGLGGLEVMDEARRRYPGLPVVMVTGHPEPFQLGAQRPDRVVTKPFANLGAVTDAVAAALEARPSSPGSLRERLTQAVAEIAPTRKKRD